MKVIKKSGFTLIELLIVIAILGILALGLIAAIDPFEQLKKGRDTGLKNTTSEFYNANLRYNANKGQFPWHTVEDDVEFELPEGSTLADLETYVTELQDAGELKANFLDLLGTNASKVLVRSAGVTDIAVCFMPESKSEQKNENTRYDETGVEQDDCKSEGGDVDCYWCVQ